MSCPGMQRKTGRDKDSGQGVGTRPGTRPRDNAWDKDSGQDSGQGLGTRTGTRNSVKCIYKSNTMIYNCKQLYTSIHNDLTIIANDIQFYAI